MFTVHLQKVGGKWFGTITEGNKVINGVAIDQENTEYNKLETFDAAVSYIKGTRPNYRTAQFFEVK